MEATIFLCIGRKLATSIRQALHFQGASCEHWGLPHFQLREAVMADAHSKPVWFITGCSTGFGRELSVILLKRGYRVVVTARDKAKVDDIVEGHDKNGLALALDVDKQNQID